MTTWLNPLAWMGPIFDKELRVASRRKRTYWLRMGYVGVMAVFLIPVWAEQLRYSAGSGLATLAASEIGIQISRILLMIQFISMQILAAFFLCTTIRDEITRRTLGVLWTTPISGFQLVIGKLTSKMLILIQLLAISIPILSMLRLFGGIPWAMLIAGLCLTLATMFVVAALSMLLSLYIRHAFAVVATTAALLGAMWGPFPILVFFGWALWNSYSRMPGWLEFGIITSNPYFSFFDQLSMGTNSSLLICCMVQIGIGALLVWITAAVVRQRGLQSMDELPRREDFRPERYHPKAVFLFRPWFAHTLIKRWLGPGMIWKESVSPFFRTRYRMLLLILMAIGIGVGLWILLALTIYHAWVTVNREIRAVVAISGFSLAVLLTAIPSVTVITGEMERQSWPILLATPWTNLHILGGKIYGVFRRSGWMWAMLVLWGMLTCWQDLQDWSEIIQWIILFAVSFGFILSLGFYLALRARRAVPAIVTSGIILGFLWIALPYFLPHAPRYVLSQPAIGYLGQAQVSDSWNSVSYLVSALDLDKMLWMINDHLKYSNPISLLLESTSHYVWYLSSQDIRYYFVVTVFLYSVLGGILFLTASRRMRRHISI